MMLFGIAVDDAHRFKQPGNPNVAGPGRGSVMVRAPRLAEVAGPSATYTFTGTEGYVRAKVLESNGLVAWTQPVIVR